MTKRKSLHIYNVRYSCLSGKAVWLNRSASKAATWISYRRAYQKERHTMTQWQTTMERRKNMIMRFLDTCITSLPLMCEMTTVQRSAARQLKKLANITVACPSDFAVHFTEERKRES